MSLKPVDTKRDEIRRYLEHGRVFDALTKVFISVIKERPEDPMEYIRNNIGVVRHQHDKYERLTKDLLDATEEIQRLRAIINSINPEVLKRNKADDDDKTIKGAVELVTRDPAELAAAMEKLRLKLDEGDSVDETTTDSDTIQNSSVQAEPNTSTENTE